MSFFLHKYARDTRLFYTLFLIQGEVRSRREEKLQKKNPRRSPKLKRILKEKVKGRREEKKKKSKDKVKNKKKKKKKKTKGEDTTKKKKYIYPKENRN